MDLKTKEIYEIYIGSSIRYTSLRIGSKLGLGVVSDIYFNENYYDTNGDVVFGVWLRDENGNRFHWKDLWKGKEDSLNITYKKPITDEGK